MRQPPAFPARTAKVMCARNQDFHGPLQLANRRRNPCFPSGIVDSRLSPRPPRLRVMVSPDRARGVRQRAPPIPAEETDVYDTKYIDICRSLGRRGGAFGARIVRKGGKARKGPLVPMGFYGKGGNLNTGTQRHSDKHGKPPCLRVSVSPCLRVSVPLCPRVQVRLPPRLSLRSPRLRVMVSPDRARGVRQRVPPSQRKKLK